ncbi:hypothetical protein [Aliiglaciecola litoralis]|uniref:hypothetical protein n=1 Tax=Aliiglaciecola litoralis TaxID=582857 RepID=UPI0031D8B43A
MYQFEFFVLPVISVLISALIMSSNTSFFKKCSLIILVVFLLAGAGVFLHTPSQFELALRFLYSSALIELVLIYLVASISVVFTYSYVSKIKLFISIVSGLITLVALPIYSLYIACYIGGC